MFSSCSISSPYLSRTPQLELFHQQYQMHPRGKIIEPKINRLQPYSIYRNYPIGLVLNWISIVAGKQLRIPSRSD